MKSNGIEGKEREGSDSRKFHAIKRVFVKTEQEGIGQACCSEKRGLIEGELGAKNSQTKNAARSFEGIHFLKSISLPYIITAKRAGYSRSSNYEGNESLTNKGRRD